VGKEDVQLKKDKALNELRTTIKFLIKEREQGREQFEDDVFFDEELERNILYNFDGILTRSEYEEVILEFFGSKIIKTGKLPVREIERETEELILKYRIRTKDILFNRIAEAITDEPNERKEIYGIIENKYDEVMEKLAKQRVQELMYTPEIREKTLKSILVREGIAVPDDFLSDLMKKRAVQLKRRQRVKAPEKSVNLIKRERQFQQRRRVIQQEKSVSSGETLVRKRYMKAFKKKEMLRKKEFLESNCISFKFSLDNNFNENGKRVFIHSSKFRNKNISVKTISEEGQIFNVVITFKNPDSKTNKEFVLDISTIIELLNAENTGEVQKLLKSVNNIMEFSNFQELLWFLSHILSERCKLPIRTSEYLNEEFIGYVKDLDSKISKYLIEKAIPKAK